MTTAKRNCKRIKPRISAAILRKGGAHCETRKAERRRTKMRQARNPEWF